MLSYSEYEKILTQGKRVEWYETEVPEKLITPVVKAMANQIVEQINKLEGGVETSTRKNYILALWHNVRNLPYTANGDFYLIKKRRIEENMKSKPKKQPKEKEVKKETKKETKTKPKPKKERISEVQEMPKKATKNSSLIFGNKNK